MRPGYRLPRLALAAFAVVLAAGPFPAARAGSETPPAGPPWVRDFHEAQVRALREGKPIFVYLTKTY